MTRTVRCISAKRKKAGKGSAPPKGKVKSNTLHGVEYTVLPIDILALDSVVDGELIRADELAFTVLSWNGRAILDAIVPENEINTPAALDAHLLGQLFRVRIEDAYLRADAWLSPKRAEAIGSPDLIAQCERGDVRISPVVSCTLIDQSGTIDGAKFSKAWTDIRPLCVSILPDKSATSAALSSSAVSTPGQAHVAERGFIAEHKSRSAAASPQSHARPERTLRTGSQRSSTATLSNVSQPITDQPSARTGDTPMPSAVTRHLNQHIDLLDLPPTAFAILSGKSRYSDVHARMGRGREEAINHLFHQHLAHLRCMSGLTQKDLAENLDVTPQSISNWETKTSSPGYVTRAAAVEVCLQIARDNAATDLDRAYRANTASTETAEAADVADFLNRMTTYLFPRRGVALAKSLDAQAREADQSRPDPHGVNKFLGAWRNQQEDTPPEHTPGHPEFKSWSASDARRAKR